MTATPTSARTAAARTAAVALLGLLLAACTVEPPTSRTGPPPAAETLPAEASSGTSNLWFDDVAQAVGVDFVHVRALSVRLWFPEIMSGGGGFLDYDGDGDLDLYLVQGGELAPSPGEHHREERPPEQLPGNRLYANQGDGTFVDVTAEAGVGDRGYGMGLAVGDVDGDGDEDLYITNVGPDVLYRNDGDGTFTDITAEAGLGDAGWGTSAAFVDIDSDGDLDLYVVRYVQWAPEREIECYAGGNERDYCQPGNYRAPAPDLLYRNDSLPGEGGVGASGGVVHFTDISEAAGLRAAFGNGLGVAPGDFDGDGRLDLYVANDGDPNQLWMNRGNGGGGVHFEDEALLAGCALNMDGAAEAGMGVVAVDVDNDGDLDLFATHLRDETNTLYLNDGGLFSDATAEMGLAAASIPYTGFGVGFADFDSDGALDLYVANGRVGRSLAPLDPADPFAEPDQVLRGAEGGGRFEEVLTALDRGEGSLRTGRAVALGDYDDDGDVDILVVSNGGRPRLLRNRVGDGRPWVGFALRDVRGGDALGARVSIESGGRQQWRQVTRSGGYLASHDPRVQFGLDGKEPRLERVVGEVVVLWPDGSREFFGPYEVGRYHELRQGGGRP